VRFHVAAVIVGAEERYERPHYSSGSYRSLSAALDFIGRGRLWRIIHSRIRPTVCCQ
jgi:hypothetical protein